MVLLVFYLKIISWVILHLYDASGVVPESFQPEDGLSLVGEDVTHGLSDAATVRSSNQAGVPCGVISPDDETLLAEQAQVDLMEGKRARTR